MQQSSTFKPEETQHESTDGCVDSRGPASPVAHIKLQRKRWATHCLLKHPPPTDYRIGGTEPRDDSAKIKPRAVPTSLHDDVLIDKCEAAFICR